ncbi:MAG: GNAT family N-acetyltransferase [Anaerolineae bacterium]|nr:GNAT family N-acetyltransferase [Anaerolineae bacterium]
MLDDVQFRPLRADEATFLIDALYHAIYIPPGVTAPPKTIVRNPDLAVYIDGFGTHSGDEGILAVHETLPVGAAWSRYIRGYGFVDETIPELSISILPDYRGMGIGTRLLEALLDRLKGSAEQVSLSVNLSNPAYRLYERYGFKVVTVDGDSAIMLRDL